MAYFGKEFKLDSQKDFDKFVESFGDKAPENYKQTIINFKGTLKLVKNGDQYTIFTSQPGGSIKEVTFKSGVPFDEELQGNKCKTTYVMNGDVLEQEMKFEVGATFNVKREFSENQILVTIKSNTCDVVATRTYK